jgi:BASS family bile acid:Na+ symporter
MGDFALIAKQPQGMIAGPISQFILLPLCAFLLGRLAGFEQQYPFIFAGLILVAASPGGVTSNLMTYFAKGDVALSISLTALSTVLSVILTPLLLTLYTTGLPEVSIPFRDVFVTIVVLVLLPLGVGMAIRAKAPVFAQRSERFFSFLGILALLFLMVVGILGNLEKFSDTARYGVRFYSVVFILTFLGMLFGALLAKLFRVNNAQVRAISLETGLQNASLAMTLAILIQDRVGDFFSSMFFTSGIFGLWMYVAGGLMMWIFPILFPLDEEKTS